MLWSREYAAADWRNGALMGNGAMAAIAYAPGGIEWVINKNTVYDARRNTADMMPHKELLKLMRERGDYTTNVLDELEPTKGSVTVRSVSAAILRFAFGNGEMGWNVPAFPKIGEELDISRGVLTQRLDAHQLHSRVKSLVPRQRDVLALRVEGTTVCDRDYRIELYRPYSDDMEGVAWHNGEGTELAFVQAMPDGTSYAVALAVVPLAPDLARVSYELPRDYRYPAERGSVSKPRVAKLTSSVAVAGDAELFLSVVSSRESAEPLRSAVAAVRSAAAAGFSALEKECADWWRSYWNKASVDFGEYSEIERYWYFSAYELAVAFGKAPMPALAGMLYGPLNATVAGLSPHNYNTDQNTQIPALPMPLVNHPELVIPFVETHVAALGVLRAHTKELFGESARGVFIPLVMNQEGHEVPSGSYRYTMCGSAYTALVLARTYDFTKDAALMREKLFPLLSELINFYAYNLLSKDERGVYHLDYTVPPEIFLMTRDETATLATLRASLRSALDFASAAGIENDDVALWRDIYEHYPSFAVRSDGALWVGRDVPEDHFAFGTHILYPVFPAELPLSSAELDSARKTLAYVDESAIERSFANPDGWHFVHGWSWFLYNSARARLGDNAAVWQELSRFIAHFAKSNGTFVHNSIVVAPPSITEKNHNEKKKPEAVTADKTTAPAWYGVACATHNERSKDMTAPVVEGNSIFLMRATEALLQSFGGVVRLFPSVPEGFSGGFAGLVARGGFVVSAKMQNGKVTFAELEATVGGTLKIFPFAGIEPPQGARLVREGSVELFVLDMKAGESVVFKRANER